MNERPSKNTAFRLLQARMMPAAEEPAKPRTAPTLNLRERRAPSARRVSAQRSQICPLPHSN